MSTSSHPETVVIGHPTAPGAIVEITWPLFRRLLLLGYVEIAPTGTYWRVSFDGHKWLRRLRKEEQEA